MQLPAVLFAFLDDCTDVVVVTDHDAFPFFRSVSPHPMFWVCGNGRWVNLCGSCSHLRTQCSLGRANRHLAANVLGNAFEVGEKR
jgi:hypothetical protein